MRLVNVVYEVIKDYDLDENAGDWTERAQTIEWLVTRGEKGKEWGHAAQPARLVGGWSNENS